MSNATVLVVSPEQARAFWLVTDHLTILLSGEDTGGTCCMAEIIVPPNEGPPPHIHRREDETFTILEGEFEFLAGDRTVRVIAGSVVYAPRNIPHTYKNVGATPARMLVFAAPAGFEKFVEAAGSPVTDSLTPPPTPDVERLISIAAEYGVEILPPPAP